MAPKSLGKLKKLFTLKIIDIFNRLDWLEPCDESLVEEFDLLAATEEKPEDQTAKREEEGTDGPPMKKPKV